MALPPWQVHFARHFLLKYLTSAWESAEANYILLPGTFFMKIFKVPGKVRKQITLCCQALFYENIKSAWQSAEANYILLPGTFL